MSTATMRIAMWSGPRNISTAMMRAWGQRPDTVVCDEPLYAHYLKQTGIDHPGRAEVLDHHECDWRRVVAWLTGPVPDGKRVFYQKHMAHHLLPVIDRGWLADLTHALLIREPEEMLTSLIRRLPRPALEDTGLPQQVELVQYLRDHTGATPVVIDARDTLENPAGMLEALCRTWSLPFHSEMLSWPPGLRETDGIWARHWYDAVEKSTGFQPYRPKGERVPAHLEPVLESCRELYDQLHAVRLKP